MQPPSKWLLILMILISFIGFFDATFLTIQHYRDGILPCVVFEGCEQVTTSKYSTIGNIPISLFGMIYYLIILISTIIYFDNKNKKAFLLIGYFPVVGFVISMFLLYLQLFIIKALCTYCLVSIISSTILFVLGLNLLKLKHESRTKSP